MYNPQVLPSTNFVDNAIDLPWRKFFKVLSLGQSSRAKYPHFGDTRIVYNTVQDWWKEAFVLILARFSQYFDTIPACGRRTDRHTTTAYTALAWRHAAKNVPASVPEFNRQLGFGFSV